jgi:hypothetical protein
LLTGSTVDVTKSDTREVTTLRLGKNAVKIADVVCNALNSKGCALLIDPKQLGQAVQGSGAGGGGGGKPAATLYVRKAAWERATDQAGELMVVGLYKFANPVDP